MVQGEDPISARPNPQVGADGGTDERLRTLEERVRELQDQQSRRPGRGLMGMLPPEVRAHLRAAQRERLLALRALVDAAIKRTDEHAAGRPRRSESVRID